MLLAPSMVVEDLLIYVVKAHKLTISCSHTSTVGFTLPLEHPFKDFVEGIGVIAL